MFSNRLAALAMGLCCLSVTAAELPSAPVLAQPQGDYETAWLDLETTNGASRVFVAWRAGRPVQFWSLSTRLPGAIKSEGNLKLLVDRVTGTVGRITVELRLVSIWAPIKRLQAQTLDLSLQREGDRFSGTWTMADNGAGAAQAPIAKGALSGRLARGEPLAAGQDWPAFYGAGAAFNAPAYGKPLVADLADARPLWRSEANCLSGWGTGVDSRYKSRAAYGTLCGGSSSPIAADGRIYLYHYRPSGDVEPEGADAELVASFKEHPIEADAVRRFFSRRADLIVSCVDAADGRTVWESVWPIKQGNFQTHKWRGLNHTPAVARGILVVSDYSHGLHAFDARTGELKWTRGGGGPVPGNQGAVGPVIAGDTVVFAAGRGTEAFDLATGAPRWKAPGASGGARRMTIAGRERILLVGDPLVLLDPADGRERSRIAFPGGWESKGRREIGRGAGANLVCEGPYIVSFETTRENDKPVGRLLALKVADDRIEPAWRGDIAGAMEDGHIGLVVARDHVFTAFQDIGAVCVELTTGRTVRQQPDARAQSNPIFVAVDDRLLWQPECQHGRQMIQLFDATPAGFGPLGRNWRPPHNDTTAYGEMPIVNVVVDGRLIVRGMDGLYAYDLRP